MASHSTRSRAWFPGRLVALTSLTGIEVIDTRQRAAIQVSKTTIHGTPAQLRHFARQIMAAAELAESGS